LVDDGSDAGATKAYAGLLEYALGKADRWTRIGLVDSETHKVDYAVLVESDTVAVLLQPRIFASWFIKFSDASIDTGQLVADIVRDQLTRQPGVRVILQVQTLDTDRNLAVRAAEGGGFDVLANVSGPDTGEGGVVELTGLVEAIKALYPQAAIA
jgi:hypothetical protein